jgi:DNA-binding protein YbaB
VKIASEVVDPNDVEMLEDLVTAALNEALEKVQALQTESMAGLAGGLHLPGGFGMGRR